MIRNNQNGRRRGRGGARPPQQGGGPSGNYGNNNGGGSRIDTRQRGNATQLLEKYKAMARDATQNGDRVQAEFYMQYADHYFRVLNEFRARDPQPAPRSTYDDDDDGFAPSTVGQNYAPASDRDDDDNDEAGDRPAYRPNGERPRGNDYQGQGDRPADRPRGNDYQGQADRPRQDRDNRDNRDSGRQRGYAPRAAADENGGDPAYRSDGRAEAPRREDGGADAPRRVEGQDATARPDGDREFSRNGRYEPARGDDSRRGGPRDGNGHDDSRGALSRDRAGDPAAREPLTAPAVEPVFGLPGPATLAPTFATAEPVAEAGDAPTPRKRGRPRKVVADSVDG